MKSHSVELLYTDRFFKKVTDRVTKEYFYVPSCYSNRLIKFMLWCHRHNIRTIKFYKPKFKG
jgi:hypothetical protein